MIASTSEELTLTAEHAIHADAPVGARVLIVDDEDPVRRALAQLLRRRGYDVQEADRGVAALSMLGGEEFDLMLCDVRMPGVSGVDVIGHALAADADLAIVMISALNDAPTATRSLSLGALDYLVKPFDVTQLEQALARALHTRSLRREQRRVERLIREEVAQQTTALERERAQLRALTVQVAEALIGAMEAKDVYLRGHSHRVAALAASIAEELGLDAETIEVVRLAARLHDVGKIGIREEVLNKPGPLTVEEFAHVQDHVRLGMEILSPLPHLGDALTFVQDHHEHWDGSGYPRGLSGAGISLGGRIVCAADAYDAITSRRPYRPPMEPREALDCLAAQVGRLLDPAVYRVLRQVVERNQALVFIDPVA